MAFVAVDRDLTWFAEEQLHKCPQVVRIVSTDTPYVCFDFTNVLADGVGIASASAAIEVNSATITIADTSVSGDSKKVSFSVAGMAAGDYLMRSSVTLSDGTTNVISRDGVLRVS